MLWLESSRVWASSAVIGSGKGTVGARPAFSKRVRRPIKERDVRRRHTEARTTPADVQQLAVSGRAGHISDRKLSKTDRKFRRAMPP